MVGFARISNELVCDGVSLSAIALAEGTPLYVYSAASLRARYLDIDAAFGDYPHTLHYALKANSTLAVARLLRTLGSAADANSIWEIEAARRAGFQPSEIVFTGVGKSAAELECGVALGLKAINVESAGELARIEAIAQRTGRTARVAIRINPDIDAKSHPHISTGLKINKFGVPARHRARAVRDRTRTPCAEARRHPRARRIANHDARSAAPRGGARRRLWSDEVARLGVTLEYLDLGGGLGISYDGRDVPSAADYADALVAEVRRTGLPVVVEPGAPIVGAGRRAPLRA